MISALNIQIKAILRLECYLHLDHVNAIMHGADLNQNKIRKTQHKNTTHLSGCKTRVSINSVLEHIFRNYYFLISKMVINIRTVMNTYILESWACFVT